MWEGDEQVLPPLVSNVPESSKYDGDQRIEVGEDVKDAEEQSDPFFSLSKAQRAYKEYEEQQ